MYGYGEEGGYGEEDRAEDGRDVPCWRSRRADDILHMQEWWLVPVTVGMCRQCLGPLGTIGAPAPVGLRQLGCDVRRAWRLASQDAVATAVLFVEARETYTRQGICFVPVQLLQAGGREMPRA